VALEALGATVTASLPGRDRPLAERIEEGAFAAFYDATAPRLWAFLVAHCRDRATADDLCQESFTRVLASRFSPQSDEHLTRYLFKTAIHLLHDRGRQARREPLALSDAPEPESGAAPPGLGRDLDRALAALKPRERQLLWLAHVEELDHRTIAEMLGARAASIRVMLHRARRRLAALLDRDARGMR
jgi:RNA polymerase sigma-70 factor (ECF subfamily)